MKDKNIIKEESIEDQMLEAWGKTDSLQQCIEIAKEYGKMQFEKGAQEQRKIIERISALNTNGVHCGNVDLTPLHDRIINAKKPKFEE